MQVKTDSLKRQQKQEVERLAGKIQDLERENTSIVDLQARIASLSKENGARAEVLNQKIEELKKENSQLVGSIDDALADVIAQRNQNERLERQLREQTKTIEQDTEVNGKLCTELDEFRETIDSWQKRAKELEKENGQLKGSISDWMASYYEAVGLSQEDDCECDGKPHPDDCESDDPGPRPRNRFVRFLKLIW